MQATADETIVNPINKKRTLDSDSVPSKIHTAMMATIAGVITPPTTANAGLLAYDEMSQHRP
jgi:hypothetical protein